MYVQAASAIESRDTETLRRLLDQGLHVNQTFGWRFRKETLLHVAVRKKQLEVVRLLAGEYGANIHMRDDEGYDPIDRALVNDDSYTAAEVLIEHSTRPDRQQVSTDTMGI